MYLLDTNIFLELLLDQDRADEVAQLLRGVPVERLYVSEFTLYSIGILLTRRGLSDVFELFVSDVLMVGGVQLIRLGPQDMTFITDAVRQMRLDFDDAYQYVVAEQYALAIVSFDADFDHTARGRVTPAEILLREQAQGEQ